MGGFQYEDGSTAVVDDLGAVTSRFASLDAMKADSAYTCWAKASGGKMQLFALGDTYPKPVVWRWVETEGTGARD
jgi:hypothetical protein